MRPGTASRTAIWVSALRGIADLEPRPVVADDVAPELVSDGLAALMATMHGAPRISRLALAALDRATRTRSRHLALRTRAIDDVIDQAMNDGATELVLLGAGLDARAYRLRSLANATVFEVDHPDTQAYKLARVGDLASVARRLVHVPVDFAMQSFAAALREAGFDPRARSVFVWEGVVMYLERAAIDETLDSVRTLACPGSWLAMTYHVASPSGLGSLVSALVRGAGEPYRTRLEPAEARALVSSHGFDVLSDEAGRDWAARYLGRTGKDAPERLLVARAT